MYITVEFTGLAREAVGQKEIRLDLDEHTTYQEIIRLLGGKYPQLIGLCIGEDRQSFMSGNLFIINGDLASPAMILQESPRNGDRLILMPVITGGQAGEKP